MVSGGVTIFHSVQSDVLHEEHNQNSVMKQACWSLFSLLARIKCTYISIDIAVYEVICTMLRLCKQIVPWLSTKIHCVPFKAMLRYGLSSEMFSQKYQMVPC
jgi:hypothetical protein